MKRIVVSTIAVAIVLTAVAVAWSQTVNEQTRGEPSWARLVAVTNWPAVQAVDGTVSVDNLPPVQDVSGTVDVGNLPPVQDVSGTVDVGNLPPVQDVSGSVAVTNLPTAPASFEFVGVTTATFLGDAGWFAMTRACYAEYGGRVATTVEVRARGNPPDVPVSAWVDFRVIATGGYSTSHGPPLIDGTGRVISGNFISCRSWGWADESSYRGVVVSPTGAINHELCDVARPVACAAPVE